VGEVSTLEQVGHVSSCVTCRWCLKPNIVDKFQLKLVPFWNFLELDLGRDANPTLTHRCRPLNPRLSAMPQVKDGCSFCTYIGYRNRQNLSEAEKAVLALAATPAAYPSRGSRRAGGKICSVCVEDQGWML
jgi:hypothetical protein